jgi:hypothetical protein
MGMAGNTIKLNGAAVFNLDEILQVNGAVATVTGLVVPANIPQVDGVDSDEIPNLLLRCQGDVAEWDNPPDSIPPRKSLLETIAELASDLNQFSNDQSAADQFITDVNTRIKSLASATPAERQQLLDDMRQTFDYLLTQSQTYQTRAAKVAGDLKVFSAKMEADVKETARVKALYQSHIDAENTALRAWETENGITPSKDLVADLTTARGDLQTRIGDDNKKLEGFGTMTGAGCAIFILTCWTGVGLIVGGSLIGAGSWQIDEARADRAAAQTTLDQAVKNLEAAQKLNALEIWFNNQSVFFSTLSQSLKLIADNADKLRGEWQSVANKLQGMSDESGTLDMMKASSADFTKTIAPFIVMARANDFAWLAQATQALQGLAFTKPRVMDYKADFATVARAA